jgi:glucose-1-phosphate thymidylyltransferase
MRDKKSPPSPEETATISNNVAIDRGTTLHSRTTIREPVIIIGDHCEFGPNTFIGPYTSIGDGSTITNSEIQNSIIMEGASIECDELITNSVIGRNIVITKNNEPPKGKRFIIGDQSKITI